MPYIDELHFRRYSDDSQALLWIMDGTADIGSVALADVDTILASDANVNLVEWSSTGWTSQSMQLNLAVKDDLKRPLFQDVNFRHALSIIVDRNQIAQLIDNGYTEPAQSAPGEGAQGYDPEWTAKWTEQDVEGAQALLEQCGLKKGADGFWAFADGTKLTLNLQYQNEADASLAELLKNDLSKAGIDATTRMYDRSIMEEMRSANEHEIVLNYENFDTFSISLRPDYFVPLRDYCVWGTAFGLWYLNSLDGKGREGAVEQGMESEEVQLQIQAAQQQAAPVQAALEQLDQYQTFYAGLISYTQGVQTAADGAETLDTGALSLKNGLTSFDTLGIQVLTDTVENKLQPLLDKGYELLEEDRNYHYQEETEGSVKFIYKMEAIGGLSE